MKKTIFEKFGNGLSREQMKNVLGGNGYGFATGSCNESTYPFRCYVTAGIQGYQGETCAYTLEDAVALNAPNFPPPYYTNLFCTY